MTDPGYEKVAQKYTNGVQFNSQIGLYDTVENNENFFIGKQWEGVEANGNPTPTFNFLKRVTLVQVATVASDNLSIQASGLGMEEPSEVLEAVNRQFAALFERNKVVSQIREFLRNAAVDGDGCMYTYFDPDVQTGQAAQGDLVTEVVENTRVHFGNPCDKEPQRQPWILMVLRKPVEEVKRMAAQAGFDADAIRPDRELTGGEMEKLSADKVSLLVYLEKDPETGNIWAGKYTQSGQVEAFRDTGLRRYPIIWMNWDHVRDCYHGHGLISQLIPNQVFVNQLFAMVMRSLQTTAFPKVIYDKTRIPYWDGGVGRAIGVNGGGDLGNLAKILDPGAVSPQIAQFIDSAITYTQNFMGSTDASLGDVKPDNTSAIIALQQAGNAPLELVKRNLYQAVEELGWIYLDMMGAYYGQRLTAPGIYFDFSRIRQLPLHLKLDVGSSSYWSEITAVRTLDNLLLQNKISLDDYLERIPDGYISKKQELIQKLREGGQTAYGIAQ